MVKVGISFSIDSKILNQINNLMKSEIVDEQGRIRERVHEGGASEFYRKLLRAGYNVKLAEFDKLSEKYGIQNNSKGKV